MTTEGATVSGAGALLVIGVVALALALGGFVVVLRRIPARLPVTATANAGLLAAQAQADADQVRVRAQAEADKILSHATEAAEQAAAVACDAVAHGLAGLGAGDGPVHALHSISAGGQLSGMGGC